MRRFIIQFFPRSVVESIHDHFNLLSRYILKAATFSKVLPYQPIGVLIQPTLPGMTTLINSEYRKLNLAFNSTGISKNYEYFAAS